MAGRTAVTHGLSAGLMFAGALVAYSFAFWMPAGAIKVMGAVLLPVFVGGGFGTLSGRTTRGLLVGLVAAAAIVVGLAVLMYLTLDLPGTR
jgi:hypothetical protein